MFWVLSLQVQSLTSEREQLVTRQHEMESIVGEMERKLGKTEHNLQLPSSLGQNVWFHDGPLQNPIKSKKYYYPFGHH